MFSTQVRLIRMSVVIDASGILDGSIRISAFDLSICREKSIMFTIRVFFCYFFVVSCIFAHFSEYKEKWVEFKVIYSSKLTSIELLSKKQKKKLYRKTTTKNMGVWQRKN